MIHGSASWDMVGLALYCLEFVEDIGFAQITRLSQDLQYSLTVSRLC